MKTKILLFSIAFMATSFFAASAQELLISEEFSTQAWADELLRLNPGTSVNPNALNPVAYTTPPTTGGAAPYTKLNAIDRYFGKYLLLGDIECLPVLPCALGAPYAHNYNNAGVETAVAFRILNPGGYIEFPELPSAGTMTLHIRDGNPSSNTTVGLEKFNTVTSVWEAIAPITLRKYNAYPTTRDEVVNYNVNSQLPITLRLINNVATTTRFIDLYRVDITSGVATDVNTLKVTPLKLTGRKLISEKPTNITIYNTVGAKVFEKSSLGEIELPASLGKGIFLVKSNSGTQKIFLN